MYNTIVYVCMYVYPGTKVVSHVREKENDFVFGVFTKSRAFLESIQIETVMYTESQNVLRQRSRIG